MQIWVESDVMGKAFESIKQGLTEAIGQAKGTQAGTPKARRQCC